MNIPAFSNDFEHLLFVDNCIAMCFSLKNLIEKRETIENIKLSDEEQYSIILNNINHEQYELIKDGLYLCKCCRRHKYKCPGIYFRNELQINYYVSCHDNENSLNCDCKCRQYLRWLNKLQFPLRVPRNFSVSEFQSLNDNDIEMEEIINTFNKMTRDFTF